ncbi:MAG: nitroreductase family protein [Candidatus Coatesbacteria bacterium]|nr:nitroreductase family protein [Candidatus Coatesbacteria bacterium]
MDENLSHHGIFEKVNEEKVPNDVLKILYRRASCRNFQDKEIEEDVQKYILKAGIHTPSGGNLQPYSIIKIQSRDNRARIAELCGQEFMARAPVHLLFCIDWHRLERWAVLEKAPFSAHRSMIHFWISFQDTLISAQNICTAADSLGLGSVYIGTITSLLDELRELLSLPEKVFPVVLLCLGYPSKYPEPRRKLAMSAIVHNEKYNELSDSDLLKAFNEKYEEQKIPINDDNMETMYEVCKAIHGEAFADNCIKSIKQRGYINPVQRYFGLHYRADMIIGENDYFLDGMKKSGFRWFDKNEEL